MPRGFAGAGDYSSFFGSIYEGTRGKKNAEQDAQDADMADKWANSLISDDEWLAYIRERITAEAGDPKRHQQWIEAYRKYSIAIDDSRAEFAFEQGGSIHDLIAYYEGRLGKMAENSVEYREVATRVNDLRDKRSSEAITTGEEELLDQIEAGKAKWEDLVTFYENQKSTIRPGSDLAKQLDKRIDDISDRILQNKVEGELERLQFEFEGGRMSGKSFGAAVRKIANQFKATDPQRYYQLLSAAQRIEKQSPGLITAARSGGGGGGSGGGGGGGSGSSTKALNLTIDALQAQRNNIQAIIAQFDAGRPAGYDPATGAGVVFNEQVVRDLDLQLLQAFDALTAGYVAKGDLSAASSTQTAKAKYVANDIPEHNTLFKEEEGRAMLSATVKRLENALKGGDPTTTAAQARDAAADYGRWVESLSSRIVKAAPFAGDTRRRLPSEEGGEVNEGPKSALEAVEADFLTRHSAIAEALTVVTTPGVDEASAAAVLDRLPGMLGEELATNVRSHIVVPALEANAREAGYAMGELEPIIGPDGETRWARRRLVSQTVILNGNAVEQQVPIVDPSSVGFEVGEDQQLVDIFVDVNGKPTKRTAIASQGTVGEVWRAASDIHLTGGGTIGAGQIVHDSMLPKISADQRKKLESSTARGLAFMQVLVNGQKWVQDPETQLWFKDHLPIRGLQLNEDGKVRVGDDGKPILDWKAYASAGGVPAPYIGKDARAMQAMVDAGVVDVSNVRGRDLQGNVTPDPSTYFMQTAYYDPMERPKGRLDGDRDTWWDDDTRSRRATVRKAAEVQKTRAAMEHRDQFLKANLEPEEYAANKRRELIRGVEGTTLAAGRVLEESGVTGLFERAARALGLNFGTSRRGDVAKAAKDIRAVRVKETEKERAPIDLPRVSMPPGLRAELPPQTFSGPVTRTAIRVPAPVKKPVTTSARRPTPPRTPVPAPTKTPTPTSSGTRIVRPGASGLE